MTMSWLHDYTDRIDAATSCFRSVAAVSISVCGLSEDAASSAASVENDFDEFDGRRRENAVKQFVDAA